MVVFFYEAPNSVIHFSNFSKSSLPYMERKRKEEESAFPRQQNDQRERERQRVDLKIEEQDQQTDTKQQKHRRRHGKGKNELTTEDETLLMAVSNSSCLIGCSISSSFNCLISDGVLP